MERQQRKRKLKEKEEPEDSDCDDGETNDGKVKRSPEDDGDDIDCDPEKEDIPRGDASEAEESAGPANQSRTTADRDDDDEAAPKPISGRVKKKKRKSFEMTTLDDLLPSEARKTKQGGYAHTNQSKSKISRANTGNTPWNKGRNRSSADRAKIAAGVRARNRAVLLEKLKRLGMSEDEWLAKKREIKYLRERVRRAKLSNAKHQEAEAKAKAAEVQRKLQAAIEATTEKTASKGIPKTENAEEEEDAADDSSDSPHKASLEAAKKIFSKEVQWTPFSFSENSGDAYSNACPEGGLGGLICCESCAAKYTLYLSGTVKDMEVHRTTRNGREIKELLRFLKEGRNTLDYAYNVAKKKIPPLPPKAISQRMAYRHTYSSKRSATHISDSSQWNMTSTIDLAAERATTWV